MTPSTYTKIKKKLSFPYHLLYTSKSPTSNPPTFSTPKFAIRRLCHILLQPTGNLHFPIHPFFKEVFSYFGISLSQLTSNSFQLLCGVMIAFRFYHIPRSPIIFHRRFYSTQAFFSFLTKLPNLAQALENPLLFIQSSTPFTWITHWQMDLPPQPELGRLQRQSKFSKTSILISTF